MGVERRSALALPPFLGRGFRLGALEPPRRDGENAQKMGENGEKMGKIRPKTREGREPLDQMATSVKRGCDQLKGQKSTLGQDVVFSPPSMAFPSPQLWPSGFLWFSIE